MYIAACTGWGGRQRTDSLTGDARRSRESGYGTNSHVHRRQAITAGIAHTIRSMSSSAASVSFASAPVAFVTAYVTADSTAVIGLR